MCKVQLIVVAVQEKKKSRKSRSVNTVFDETVRRRTGAHISTHVHHVRRARYVITVRKKEKDVKFYTKSLDISRELGNRAQEGDTFYNLDTEFNMLGQPLEFYTKYINTSL